jgi:hypothetical protein
MPENEPLKAARQTVRSKVAEVAETMIQRIIITSLAIGLLLVWRERRPMLIFAAGGLFLCVGIAFLYLFVLFATHA